MSHRPLQNRVDPWGTLCAVPERGTLMGNRGILHDANSKVVRPWAHKAWVTCLPSSKGVVRRAPFSQNNYSELFFLDEATALAAGHRPCARCQPKRYVSFKQAWLHANVAEGLPSSTRMSEIDTLLHSERAIRGGGKRTFDASLAELPLGAMFEHEGLAYLLDARGCLQWSFGGYAAPTPIDGATTVKVLTPRSILRAFANGFSPAVHDSAHAPLPDRQAAAA